jgi:hypothetical protein
VASKGKGHDSQRGKPSHTENPRELTSSDDASSHDDDEPSELDQAARELAGAAEVLRELSGGQPRELAADAEQPRELAADAEQPRELAAAERRPPHNRDAEQLRELAERRPHKSSQDEDASDQALRVRLRIARWRWPHLFPTSSN